MSEVQIDVQRLAAIAEQLRQQRPNASAEVARPMIDAAGELQRLVDQFDAFARERAKAIMEHLSDICPCPDCRAKREGNAPGSLN